MEIKPVRRAWCLLDTALGAMMMGAGIVLELVGIALERA
jgi:hypothetical protein